MSRFRTIIPVAASMIVFALLATSSHAQVWQSRSAERRIAPPMCVEISKLVPGDAGARYNFGSDLAIDGDTLVVGSPFDDKDGLYGAGAAHVFTRENGQWIFQQRITASAPQRQAYFGAPTLHGDTLFIGAHFQNVDGYSSAGAVYVFSRSSGGDRYWFEQARLTASDRDHWDQFGISTAAFGDTLVVGTRGANKSYVFTRSDGLWEEQQILEPSDESGTFGEQVAFDGDTIMVGAPQTQVSGHPEAGAVYMFGRSGSVWTERQKLTPSDPANSWLFGESVELYGSIAVVGASWEDVEAEGDEGTELRMDAGAVYLFERSGSTWNLLQKLTAQEPISTERLGLSAVLVGDVLVAGAGPDWSQTPAGAGAVYLFTRSGEAWQQRLRVRPSDGISQDGFGHRLRAFQNTIVVGAPYHDHSELTDAGAVYIFQLRPLRTRDLAVRDP